MNKVLLVTNYADQFLIKELSKLSNYSILSPGYNRIAIFDLKDFDFAEIDCVIMHISERKLYDSYCQVSNRSDYFRSNLDLITNTIEFLSVEIKVPIIFILPKFINDSIHGMSSFQRKEGFNYFVFDILTLLRDLTFKFKGLELIVPEKLHFSYRNFIFSDLPYEITSLSKLAFQITKKLNTLSGLGLVKCIVCDLDNTLWGGVLGDDGIERLEFSPNGRGKVFFDIQTTLLRLKEKGILLAIISKNYHEVVIDAFSSNRFVLKLDDFVVIKANWERKSKNMIEIINELSLTADSFLFLDDNPVERNDINSLNMGIVVPDLGVKEAESILSYLSESHYFDSISTVPLKDRTKDYQNEFKRVEIKKSYHDESEFLRSLKLFSSFDAFNLNTIDRIHELFTRSNQFNLTTIRRSKYELKNIINSSAHITLSFNLRDDYGDFGLVSCIIIEKIQECRYIISDWIMSCRVLNRSLEEFIILTVISLIQKEFCTSEEFTLIGEYRPTKKNSMVSGLYTRMGFVECGEGFFEYTVSRKIETKLKSFVNHG